LVIFRSGQKIRDQSVPHRIRCTVRVLYQPGTGVLPALTMREYRTC
jgi:hypothetical protein